MANCIKLYACCIPVKGAQRSTICDLQRNDFDIIPNSLFDLLDRFDGADIREIKRHFHPGDHEVIDDYIGFLLEKEYIFLTDTPDRFPKLPDGWESPHAVTNAIIDFDADSSHNLADIVAQLTFLRCQALEMRFFSEITYGEIMRVLHDTQHSSLRSVSLVVKYTEALAIEVLRDAWQEKTPLISILLHSYPAHLAPPAEEVPLFATTTAITDETHCGVIDEYNFNVNIPLFTESKRFNNCLNRKISIDRRGNIKNCPSYPQTFGHVSDTSLVEVVNRKSFRKVWEVKKDDIEVCRDCEFRYICVDCRAYRKNPDDLYSKPAKCRYNPYTAEYEEVVGEVLEQTAR